MSLWAILPVRSFSAGKQRLADCLDAPARERLCRALLDRALAALMGSRMLAGVLVVSADAAVLAHARAAGAAVLQDAGSGLNAAVQAGADWALAQGADTVLVMHADLPLVSTAAVDALIERHRALPPPACTLVPDRHGQGTNLLLVSPPAALPFAFGEGSLARHRQRARQRGLHCLVQADAALGHDLDTAEDLQALPAPGWTDGAG